MQWVGCRGHLILLGLASVFGTFCLALRVSVLCAPPRSPGHASDHVHRVFRCCDEQFKLIMSKINFYSPVSDMRGTRFYEAVPSVLAYFEYVDDFWQHGPISRTRITSDDWRGIPPYQYFYRHTTDDTYTNGENKIWHELYIIDYDEGTTVFIDDAVGITVTWNYESGKFTSFSPPRILILIA